MNSREDILHLPKGIGRRIVEAATIMSCPLLGTERFADFCAKRGLQVDSARLRRLEALGLFLPVFRVTCLDPEQDLLVIPLRDEPSWFDRKLVRDTTDTAVAHPRRQDDEEGYYSIFQIDHLRLALSAVSINVQLDWYIDDESKNDGRFDGYVDRAAGLAETLRGHQFRPAIALLCQYISNRYYPKTQSDRRQIRSGGSSFDDRWISVRDLNWNWYEYAADWDSGDVQHLFQLTPKILRHAYEALVTSLGVIDPLHDWYPLVQFVSLDKRRRLKGDALYAETVREGAQMLAWLYRDLYNEELPGLYEVARTIIVEMPEQQVRTDPRRHLEFVANDFHVNPQPKLVLFVEGATEQRVVERLFEEYFGISLGACGIELLVIHGVGNATGNRRQDRYRAILRLIDYLHHHQTLVFVLLDNENNASRLKSEAAKAKSIHGARLHITRREYIKVWKRNFEFDNFSNTEIASVLSEICGDGVSISRSEVAECRRARESASHLAVRFKDTAGFEMPKVELAERFVDRMFSPSSGKAIGNYPIVQVLIRVLKLAGQNPLPVRLDHWEKNQRSIYFAKH